MSEAHFKTIHFRNSIMVLKSLKIEENWYVYISSNNFGHEKTSTV